MEQFGTTIFSAIYATFQHDCNIVLNSCNNVPTLQCCVLLKIVVEIVPCNTDPLRAFVQLLVVNKRENWSLD